MGEQRKLWIGYHHLKLLITISLWTPLAKLIFSEKILIDCRFYWMISIILVAPYMRFYREKHSIKKIEDI